MKSVIKDFLENVRDTVIYGLRLVCGRLSPVKRLVAVSFTCAALAIASIYFIVSSIYNIGKRDAEKEFMNLQHIESLKLQQRQDSINSINN